jgi:hypothetical protein
MSARVTADAVESELPAEWKTEGWWTRSISHGDCHYGHIDQATGVVTAPTCGLEFVPDDHPWTHKPVCQRMPADQEHACPSCLREHPVDWGGVPYGRTR